MSDAPAPGASPLLTPIFLATGPAAPATAQPEPRVHYVLASNGLFLVRRNEFYRSCVPAPRFPCELEAQAESFEAHFPRLPQPLFEAVVGFFWAAAESHGAEAGVLLYWDGQARRVRVVAPPQVATISGGSRGPGPGRRGTPVGLHYEIPRHLPAHWRLFGDVHSHAALPAYASSTDQHDERQSPGLHVVVGKIHDEPPAFHVEAVVDEQRFPLTLEDAVEGYAGRRPFPGKWARRLRILDVDEYEREQRRAAAEAEARVEAGPEDAP